MQLFIKSFKLKMQSPLDQHIQKAWDFYNKLNKPKFIVAPMVDQSELAFRILTRRYKAQLCYTPMLHSKIMVNDKHYKSKNFDPHKDDTPLFVQFCANDPDTLLSAAKLVESQCDAVDINLGCPQGIARKGRYGSFLLKETELICSMVKNLKDNLKVPVTCKIRILPTEEETITLCKKIEEAGCYILTVHGRIKDQNKDRIGKCDWDIIKKIKQTLRIPIFANGGIYQFEDVLKMLEHTGVDGVMSAEAILENPCLFSGEIFDLDKVAMEYLEICKEYGQLEARYIRPHLFKILFSGLQNHHDLRERLGRANKFEEFYEITMEMIKRRENVELKEKFGWYLRHQKRLELKKEGEVKSEEKRENEEKAEGEECLTKKVKLNEEGEKNLVENCSKA